MARSTRAQHCGGYALAHSGTSADGGDRGSAGQAGNGVLLVPVVAFNVSLMVFRRVIELWLVCLMQCWRPPARSNGDEGVMDLGSALCATCEIEVPWPPVVVAGGTYCCNGCASG